MPDISMCNNESCPFKEYCYRFKAEPSMMQYYSKFEPYTDEDENMVCDWFQEIKN